MPPQAATPPQVPHPQIAAHPFRLHERRPTPPAHAHERERAKRAADRHSRLVRWMKIGLPIAGVIVAGAVIVRMLAFSFLPRLDMPTVLFSKNGLTMVEPHLAGRSRDRAYDIVADRATQDFANPKDVHLEHLSGRIEMNDGNWAKVVAKTGQYDGNNDQLTLSESVEVTTSNGYLLKGTDASISLSKGDMSTDSPVHIVGPAGTIDSKGARVSDNGKQITFINGVHAEIRGAAMPLPSNDAPVNQSTTAPGVQP
ncbi:MAG: LPS export ABC transporter periplasmic protein LptC [Ancalomicrobiaceae bacterium]|nr:LPS export ABC transporter periplasmic protein LptC [Ancalomicrobiaceae bacterium]